MLKIYWKPCATTMPSKRGSSCCGNSPIVSIISMYATLLQNTPSKTAHPLKSTFALPQYSSLNFHFLTGTVCIPPHLLISKTRKSKKEMHTSLNDWYRSGNNTPFGRRTGNIHVLGVYHTSSGVTSHLKWSSAHAHPKGCAVSTVPLPISVLHMCLELLRVIRKPIVPKGQWL